MPQVKEITVYNVNELSDRARDRAYNNWIEGNDYPYASEKKDSLYKFAELVSVEVEDY